VAPAARAYHFHPTYGGIRQTKGQQMHQSLWDGDEKIFRERMRGWMKTKKRIDHPGGEILTGGDGSQAGGRLIGIRPQVVPGRIVVRGV
jgi:hypothetical protein